MPITTHHSSPLHDRTHQPFWLIVATILAFLLAVLWARPIG